MSEKWDMNFKSFEEFIDYFNRGGELEFIYNGVIYGATMPQNKKWIVYEAYCNEEDVLWCSSPREMLEYEIEGKKLKDILFEIEVTDRLF